MAANHRPHREQHTVSGERHELRQNREGGRDTAKAQGIAQTLETRLAEGGLEAVDDAIRELMLLAAPRGNFECDTAAAVSCAIDEIELAYKSDGPIGIPTGLKDLDDCIGGLRPPDLIVIGARPSIGKTALLLNLADNSKHPAGIISAEQGRTQVGLRLIAKNGSLNAYRLRIGKIEDEEWPRIVHAASVVKDRKVRINDQPNPTIEEVMRQARKWKFQYGIQALYVDYIQRIRALPKAPRHEQVGYVALSLKELARELNIPVIALAQVNRNVEERENKRPTMADLKDSGSIEQEADTIITLYRDEVYDEETPNKGIAELNVLKNRHGPTGMIRCVWIAESMSFHNMDFQHYAA
jgi:replicative DNA helicase